MKSMHWSQIFAEFIIVEVTYTDGARQAWEYDCAVFDSIENLKKNMMADFVERRPTWESAMVHVATANGSYSSEITVTNRTSEKFTAYVFNKIEDMLKWQPVVIS